MGVGGTTVRPSCSRFCWSFFAAAFGAALYRLSVSLSFGKFTGVRGREMGEGQGATYGISSRIDDERVAFWRQRVGLRESLGLCGEGEGHGVG